MESTQTTKEKFIFIRHLEDINDLRQYMFDAPLAENQEDIIESSSKKINSILHRNIEIRIIHSSQIRSKSTANILVEKINNKNVFLITDTNIDDFSQGMVMLPNNYTYGESLPILKKAWNDFEREAFMNKRLEYVFGQDSEESFTELGESASNFLNRNYNFVQSLLSGEYRKNDSQVIICCHSTTILIMLELVSIISNEEVFKRIQKNPKELPFVSWDIYKNLIQKNHPNGVKFGEVFEFDMTEKEKKEIILILENYKDTI